MRKPLKPISTFPPTRAPPRPPRRPVSFRETHPGRRRRHKPSLRPLCFDGHVAGLDFPRRGCGMERFLQKSFFEAQTEGHKSPASHCEARIFSPEVTLKRKAETEHAPAFCGALPPERCRQSHLQTKTRRILHSARMQHQANEGGSFFMLSLNQLSFCQPTIETCPVVFMGTPPQELFRRRGTNPLVLKNAYCNPWRQRLRWDSFN